MIFCHDLNKKVLEKIVKYWQGGELMKANVGPVDRLVRIILGLILLSLLFILDGTIKYIGLVGIVLLITAFIKFCPLYPIFKINTNKDAKM